jgi:putative DNA primase/helicase
MSASNTVGDIRAALACIPANERDLWVRIAMAIHSELPDDVGLDLFDGWSRTAENYDSASVRDTWRGLKAGGGVAIGTLWHEARLRGYKGSVPRQTPEDAQRLAAAAAHRVAEAAKVCENQNEAAAIAKRLWKQAVEPADSSYLVRKGVKAYGLRKLSDGRLVVPLRDAAGEVGNLQFIAPDGSKRFLKWGRKAGMFYLFGEDASRPVIVVAEGVATAASVHEATGLPVAVAFDAGNLLKVARVLAGLYPAARLLIAGDDDTKTPGNPGRTKATAAARAVNGAAVFPSDLPDGGTDFNDLHQSRGLDAVRTIIEAAAASLAQSADASDAGVRQVEGGAASEGVAMPSAEGLPRASSGEGEPARPEPLARPSDVTPSLLDAFVATAEGVWFTERERDGQTRPVWVCSRLEVQARTKDVDGDGWGYLLSFDDPTGRPRTWAMPARLLAGDGNEYRSVLLGMGLRIAPGAKARNLLGLYLQATRPEAVATCTDRIGWHATDSGAAFVLPRETLLPRAFGDDESAEPVHRIVYQTDGPNENPFRVRGTAEGWRSEVGALCVGSSRLVFAVSAAFAGPLLRLAGIDSGGFHLRGSSSCGKTTVLRVAASVFGGPRFLQRWRATDSALETMATNHSDTVLILDELAQVDSKAAGEIAYMLANETGKARSTRTGHNRARLTWRLVFLSAGEVGLAAHMAEGGKRARAGQELRLVDLPAEAFPGSVFEDLHGHEGGAQFALALTRATERHHGHPGLAWLRWCVDQGPALRQTVRSGIEAHSSRWVRAGASGQIERVARRFALVAEGGELATAAGMTGWRKGEATAAAEACFRAWLDARPGGDGDAESAAMLSQVRKWLQLNGAGRFTWWHRAMDDRAPDKGLRAGYRRMVTEDGKPIQSDSQHADDLGVRISQSAAATTTTEYFVFTDVFRAEACEGFDSRAVLMVLKDAGHLLPDKGRPFDCKPRLPGLGPVRCFRIASTVFADG